MKGIIDWDELHLYNSLRNYIGLKVLEWISTKYLKILGWKSTKHDIFEGVSSTFKIKGHWWCFVEINSNVRISKSMWLNGNSLQKKKNQEKMRVKKCSAFDSYNKSCVLYCSWKINWLDQFYQFTYYDLTWFVIFIMWRILIKGFLLFLIF